MYGASCPEEQGIAVLQKALKAGAKTISTADFYGDDENEKLIGKHAFPFYSLQVPIGARLQLQSDITTHAGKAIEGLPALVW